MRLIDADKINFVEVFGGQSDFAKEIRESAENLINRQPTAFDKEKVIEELKTRTNGSFFFSDWCESEELFGRAMGYKNAIKIVEKGGIE